MQPEKLHHALLISVIEKLKPGHGKQIPSAKGRLMGIPLTAHLLDELHLRDDVEAVVLRAALRTADTLVVATVLASLVTNSQHTLPSLDLLLEILTENYQISISCLKPRKSATPLFRLFNNILPS